MEAKTDIEYAFDKLKRGQMITFKDNMNNNKIRHAYFTKFYRGRYWATTKISLDYDAFPVYPSKRYELVKIGSVKIESKEHFYEREEAKREVEREEKAKEIKDIHKYAKWRSLKYPNID